jgi:hypothetical protein
MRSALINSVLRRSVTYFAKRTSIGVGWTPAIGGAGYIRIAKRAAGDKDVTQYRMFINRNHLAPIQFATLGQ